ncbi:hypothetical protein D3C75_756280 [compost metagenome]
MGYAPQQIAPQLLLLDLHGDFLLLFIQARLLQGQPAFTEHGNHQAFFEHLNRLPLIHHNSHHGKNRLSAPDSKIQAAGSGEGVRRGSGALVVLVYPIGHSPFILVREQLLVLIRLLLGKKLRCRQPAFVS